jgi:quercetin dioxygenase-like cupin family protein
MTGEKEYKEYIEMLRVERLSKREQVNNLTDELKEIMRSLSGSSTLENKMVSLRGLEKLDIGEKIQISDDIGIQKYKETESEVYFRAFVKAGGKFGVHQHDVDEHTTVVKGHLIELTDNNKMYSVGETVIYLSRVLHEPSCKVDSEYRVIFKK